MRLHVGGHIARGETVGQVCGLCGTLCSHPVKIIHSSGTGHLQTYKSKSGCKYFSDFSSKSAINNIKGRMWRPVECDVCANGSIFWNYNLEAHYKDRHSFIVCPLIIDEEERLIMKTS